MTSPKTRTIRRQLWLFGAMAVAGLLFYACNSRADDAQADPGDYPIRSVWLDELPLRKAPGDSADIVTLLHRGDKVYDMGEVSPFTSQLHLQGKTMTEPWLLVKTGKGFAGWVYAGGLDWSGDYPALLIRRLEALAGKTTAQRVVAYQSHFQHLQSATDFASVYREAMALRDTLAYIIRQKTTADEWRQYDWIGDILPAFVPAVESGYYLFADYRQWSAKAVQTPEADDDQFVALMLDIYPEDSIAYLLPAWVIQSSPGENHSLLGRGLHKKILEACAGILAQSRLFEPEIIQLKSAIVNDITGAGVTYWENSERIMAEMDDILQLQGGLLSTSDLIALRTRRKQLETPEVYEIRLDIQSGRQ